MWGGLQQNRLLLESSLFPSSSLGLAPGRVLQHGDTLLLESKSGVGYGLLMICMISISTLNSSKKHPSGWCKCNPSGRVCLHWSPAIGAAAYESFAMLSMKCKGRARVPHACMHAVGAYIALSGRTAI